MRIIKLVLKIVLGIGAAFVAVILTITMLMAVGVIKADTPKPPFPSVVVEAPKPTSVVAAAQPAKAPVASAAPPPAPAAPPSNAAVTPPPERHWYDGGTLSGAGALEWQKATPENKLASCADILAKLWMDKKLNPELTSMIHSVDDLKIPATQLVIGLDKALVGDPDPIQNRRMLTNQTVAEMSIVVMSLMGWLQTS